MASFEQSVSDFLCQMAKDDHYGTLKQQANRRLAPYRYGNGRVLLFDNCEHTSVLWESSVNGGGAVAVSNTMCWDTDKAYKLTVGAANADFAIIERTVQTQLYDGYVGIDFYFSITDSDFDSFDDFSVKVYGYNSINGSMQGEIILKPNASVIGMPMYYLNSAAADVLMPQTFPLVDTNDQLSTFHHVKLVIDVFRVEYYYLIVDDIFIDMRGKGLRTVAGTSIARFKSKFSLNGLTGGGATDVFIDQITFTDKEKLPNYPEQYEKYTEL